MRIYPRAIGKEWQHCAWCRTSSRDLRSNFASFVPDEETGLKILDLMSSQGMPAWLDTSRADEGRYQVKIGACDDHFINLKLLLEILKQSQEMTQRILEYTKS